MNYSECDEPVELKYFREIPELMIDNIDAVAFSEEMTIFNENFKSIGYIKSSVEKIDDCLLSIEVRSETFDEYVPPHLRDPDLDDTSSSSSSIMGYSTNLAVTALVDRCFNVYRERILMREEQYNKKRENIRYLVKVGKNYYFDTKINEVQDLSTYKKVSSCEMINVLTESSNLLLLKVIALKNYLGTFKACTFDLEGNIRPCVYTAGPGCVKYFRKQKVVFIKVMREIFFANGSKTSTSSILATKNGRAAKHWWSDSRYCASTDPKYFLRENHICDRPMPTDILEKCPKISDLFTNRVKNNMSNHKKYLDEHPEILDVLNRFSREILLRKPENLMNFTLIFFSNLKQTIDKYK